MDKRIIDIHCPNCGAPANFDIITQRYVCGYCGGKVGIDEAVRQKEGFKKVHADKLRNSVKSFSLFSATCEGCGATVVFEENEVLSKCAFCGRNMVRKEYLNTKGLPECIIPFAVTLDEAKELLRNWCNANSTKQEARLLLNKIDDLKGFYLPYELIRGPVHMTVSRKDKYSQFNCEGFINDEFVNRSKQLDNLLLDGMEPYDLDRLEEFDFAYVAGQRVKISDISDSALEQRVKEESSEIYAPYVRKVLQSRAVDVYSDVSSAMRLPALLPVYYIADGELMAAVNGQTGKVSVRSLKDSHYYFTPWWFKAIIATLVFSLAVYLGMVILGSDNNTALIAAGMLALVLLIINLCVYSDTAGNAFRIIKGRDIYTSGEKTFVRENGELVLEDKLRERKAVKPVFTESVNGELKEVELKFATPLRIVRMVLLGLLVIFLPVILALFINGFDFERLTLGGSAVWFCITVPVVPVYILRLGILELHDNPWIYIIENGHKKRFRDSGHKNGSLSDLFKEMLSFKGILILLAVLGIFAMMVWMTAFGFD